MTRSIHTLPLGLVFFLVMIAPDPHGSLHGQGAYDYTFFGYPGATLTHPYAINNAGVVVGSFEYGNHGFVRDAAGVFSQVDYPGASDNLLRSINNSGVVAGKYRFSGLDYGFTYSQGVWATLPAIPGNPNFGAFGINDAEFIVGRYVTLTAATHGFLYDGIEYTTVDYPGALHTLLTDIDDQGLMIGNYWVAGSGRWRGFTYDGAGFTPVDKPGAYWTYLAGINNLGEIVGQEVDPSGAVRTAIHYDGQGTWTTLDVPGVTGWTGAQDINDLGVICGYAYDETFTTEQGFIAEPVSPQEWFLRGDANGDGSVGLGDAIYSLAYLFLSGPSLCLDAHDIDDDGAVGLGDVITLLAYLFSGGTMPPLPHPDCGDDPTLDSLSCDSSPACP